MILQTFYLSRGVKDKIVGLLIAKVNMVCGGRYKHPLASVNRENKQVVVFKF